MLARFDFIDFSNASIARRAVALLAALIMSGVTLAVGG